MSGSIRHFAAVDDHLSLLIGLQQIDAADQRRFARAGWAANYDPLAFGDR
jgi:hypothetical protein